MSLTHVFVNSDLLRSSLIVKDQSLRKYTLTGIGDIDLLIIEKLLDIDVENLEKCVSLKDSRYFWQSRLKNKYNVIIFDSVSEEKEEINWKKIYIDYSRFFEYFNLTLFVALLKDYYFNDFAIFFLIYLRKKVKYEGFFPLLKEILDILEDPNVLTLEKYLISKKETLTKIQQSYLDINYEFSYGIKISDNLLYLQKDDLLFFLYTRIFKRDNIFSYKLTINSEGLLNITFNCDG